MWCTHLPCSPWYMPPSLWQTWREKKSQRANLQNSFSTFSFAKTKGVKQIQCTVCSAFYKGMLVVYHILRNDGVLRVALKKGPVQNSRKRETDLLTRPKGPLVKGGVGLPPAPPPTGLFVHACWDLISSSTPSHTILNMA